MFFSDGFGGSWYFDALFEHPESDFTSNFYTGISLGTTRLLSNKTILYGEEKN
jgi:hypothetical protein